jgi:hypothetical protein
MTSPAKKNPPPDTAEKQEKKLWIGLILLKFKHQYTHIAIDAIARSPSKQAIKLQLSQKVNLRAEKHADILFIDENIVAILHLFVNKGGSGRVLKRKTVESAPD